MTVNDEWRWLFALSELTTLTASTFQEQVLLSTDVWFVMFSDGIDCQVGGG